MKQSTAIITKRNQKEVVNEILGAEIKELSDKLITVYASSDVAKSIDFTHDKLKIIKPTDVMFKELLAYLLSFDTARRTGLFEIPNDFVLVMPECNKHTKLVPPELLNDFLTSLAYIGIRVIFIDEDINSDLLFEEFKNVD